MFIFLSIRVETVFTLIRQFTSKQLILTPICKFDPYFHLLYLSVEILGLLHTHHFWKVSTFLYIDKNSVESLRLIS